MSKKVGFFPEVNEKQPSSLHKHGGGGGKVGVSRKRVVIRIWTLRLPRSSGFSPVRFLKLIGAKVARALRLVSMRKRSSSRKVSSSCLTRSRSYADQIDSHRAQAVEDCIEFLNSSSSSSFLQRSNSVSSTSC